MYRDSRRKLVYLGRGKGEGGEDSMYLDRYLVGVCLWLSTLNVVRK